MVRFLNVRAIAGLLCALATGCAVDVDLSADPTANVGDPVNFKVKVTNRSNCPIGIVTAVIIPFVPKDLLISKIKNDDLREHLSDAVERFCSGEEVEVPDEVSGECVMDSGDLLCTIDLGEDGEIDVGTGESLLGMPADSPDISCESDGSKITCRISQALLDTAAETVEGQEQAPLNCMSAGPLVVCVSLKLSPQEMQMAAFQLIADGSGTFHHFVVAFPLVSGGVCRTGFIAGSPCNEDTQTQCPTAGTPDCAPGICTNGANNGKGCDPAQAATHCPGGTCAECEVPHDGRILTGVACATTRVGSTAPAMSHWGYAATAVMLFGATLLLLRARRRRA